MKKNRATAIDILLLTGAILLLFYAVFHFKYRVEYDKLAGDNIWQSASTIKYADMWLEEGPDALHFTAYENFPSIEFASLEDRTPFISYPSEHTLLVYLAARAAGRTEIDISFLKHFQLLLFALEALVLGLFLYIFMLDIGYRSRAGRIVFAAAGAILWTLFPVNTYYLANIFFTDQSVIFWLFWFILTDYMIHRKGSRTALRRLLTLPLWLVIICGMLTDYFFWILVFFVAVFRWLGRWVITQNWRNGLPEFFLRYSFPVAISLVLFFWQLSYTPNWLRTLLYKLEHRSGGFDNTESVFARLLENLTSGFFSSQRSVLLYYVFLLMITLVGTGIYLHRHHAGGLLFANNAAALFGASYLAIVVHTLLLKNHAAVHEFSMVKVSWIIITSIYVMAWVAIHLVRFDGRVHVGSRTVEPYTMFACFFFLLIMLFAGIPSATSAYWTSRDGEEDHSAAAIIRAQTDYNDVLFSFTMEIPEDPPNELAVSHKRVYLIKNVKDMGLLFPALPLEAKRLLVVEKKKETTPQVLQAESDCLESLMAQGGRIRYEDDILQLVEAAPGRR